MNEIQAQLRQIERKNWWLWMTSVLMLPLVTIAVLVLSRQDLGNGSDPFFQFQLEQSARGLMGVILIFCIYSIYQQTLLKRLRRQEAEHLFERSKLEIKAEVARQLAMIDPLTGVCNRRFLDQHLETEVRRAERHDYPLTLLMLDLNNFKEINDRCGHPVGDLILQQFSQHLRATLRSSDIVVRMGGDEFLAVLPDCEAAQVPALVSRMKGLEVDYQGGKIPVDFAAGYATYQRDEPFSDLLERADKAVYEDKRASKAAATTPA